MEEINISTFKAKCLGLLERVRKTRKPIRVTRRGEPVAEIMPPSILVDRDAWIGSLKGTVEIKGDIISPADDEEDWEVLRD
jgi:prevent-host-death family protein